MAAQASNILGTFPLQGNKTTGSKTTGSAPSFQTAATTPTTSAGLLRSTPSSATGSGFSLGALVPPSTQEVKSHTDALGNSQTYYPSTPTEKPASTTSTPASSPTAPQGGTTASYGNGALNDFYNTQLGALSSNSGNAASTGSNNYNSANAGLLNSLPNNQNLAQNAQNIANKYSSIANPYLAKAKNEEIGNIGTGLAPVGQGIASTIQNAAGSYLSGLAAQEGQELAANNQGLTAQGQTQSGYGTALTGGLTGQNQGITGIGNAASLASPVAGASFFGSPTSGGLVGTGNQLVDTNVAQALQLVRNGASVSDPQISQLLSISPLAQQAFNQAQLSGGNYNPTVQAATAGQNANLATQAQQQLFDLNQGRSNLDNTAATAVNFLNSSGLLNPGLNPNSNQGINTYANSFLSPGQVTNYNAIMAELRKFQSQILASNNGQTPTGVTADVLSADPSKLSATQLVPFIQQLQQAGAQQASVLQKQYGQTGGAPNGYTGAPENITTNAFLAPTGNQNQNLNFGQNLQAGIGGAQNVIGGGLGIVQGLAGKLFGQ